MNPDGSPSTSAAVDKETVKIALREILEEIPSFRAFMQSGNPDRGAADPPVETNISEEPIGNASSGESH